ncbi:uncharacterized protein [Eurosta solidaginis]|uniref:uncharacterized protein n=1 Tax=Eurosta solidaginis TaxID=178769 RepID=UPI0035309DA4
MFEDTLLIIKSDYVHKRKPVLLHLLQHEFMIKGQRKLLFSPEYAAEFYKPRAEDKDFMLQVILLSKGNSEAFILTKENAVADLLCTMICYFTSSAEMERNVHVSKCPESARREIKFIFPNYIPEPIPGSTDPLMTPFISKLYEIAQKPDESKSWKVQLAEWLTLSNPELPVVSNMCRSRGGLFFEDKAQQVNLLDSKDKKPCSLRTDGAGSEPTSTDISFASSCSSTGDSAIMSSSSCITCRPFDHTDVDASVEDDVIKKAERIFAPKTAALQNRVDDDDEEECEDEMCVKVCQELMQRWKGDDRADQEEMKKVLPYGGKDMETIDEAENEEEHFLMEE